MVFTQGMEISVLLHVTDFLGSPWASSLISEAVRPIASQRCITRWDGASACKVWAPALLIYVRAFARIRGRWIGPHQRRGRSDTDLGGLGCHQGWHLLRPLPSWRTLRTPKSSFSTSGVASPLKFSMSKLSQNLQLISTSTGTSWRRCEDQLEIWDLPLPRDALPRVRCGHCWWLRVSYPKRLWTKWICDLPLPYTSGEVVLNYFQPGLQRSDVKASEFVIK